jgi:hypothetical protein
MSQENVNLNESYLTLALQVSSIFVSSFPGFIVIGKIQQNHFEFLAIPLLFPDHPFCNCIQLQMVHCQVLLP